MFVQIIRLMVLLQVGSVDAKNVEEHLMGGKAGNISGSQISVSALDPTHYDASFGKVQAGDVQWKDSSLGSLDLNKTNANIRDGSVNATVHSANMSEASLKNDQISSLHNQALLKEYVFSVKMMISREVLLPETSIICRQVWRAMTSI